MLPKQEILEKISQKIKDIPNRSGECKRKIHYCCYLLCYGSGLRISEAIRFDLAKKNKNGLYTIEKPKGKKERLVYVPKKVISELKVNNWKPNQTSRFSFFHFLRKVKRELNLEKSTELSPHTLRRSFTTYHAEQGVPLPLLQKILGHTTVQATALYWRNIYHEDDDDIGSILTGKQWLEKPKSQPLPAKPTIFSPTEKEEITSGQENGFLPIFEENSPKRAKNAILPESKNPKILIQNQPQNQPPIKNSSPPIETKKPISIEPNSLPKNTQKQLLPPISKQEQKNNECRVLSDKNCFELSQNQKKRDNFNSQN